jgi:hypothetical protein
VTKWAYAESHCLPDGLSQACTEAAQAGWDVVGSPERIIVPVTSASGYGYGVSVSLSHWNGGVTTFNATRFSVEVFRLFLRKPIPEPEN